MLDKRTKKEKKKAAQECYDRLTASGRRSCSGCHLDCYCPSAHESYKMMVEFFKNAGLIR